MLRRVTWPETAGAVSRRIREPAEVGPDVMADGRAPGVVLRIEGLVVFVAAIAVYAVMGGNWWLFAGLFLLPDLGMIGYAAGPRVGAATYNLTHTLALPLLLGVGGLAAGSETAVLAAVIWVAHIGFDRALGFGLKYPTHFRDTHLQRVA